MEREVASWVQCVWSDKLGGSRVDQGGDGSVRKYVLVARQKVDDLLISTILPADRKTTSIIMSSSNQGYCDVCGNYCIQ